MEGGAGTHAEATGRDTKEDLFATRAGSGMHRQRPAPGLNGGQGAQAVGVWGESVGGHAVAAFEGRAVRDACEGAAGQAL